MLIFLLFRRSSIQTGRACNADNIGFARPAEIHTPPTRRLSSAQTGTVDCSKKHYEVLYYGKVKALR